MGVFEMVWVWGCGLHVVLGCAAGRRADSDVPLLCGGGGALARTSALLLPTPNNVVKAMKMRNVLKADAHARVGAELAAVGDVLRKGQVVLELKGG